MLTMRKSTISATVVLIAALSLSVALADHIKERASRDRLSFGDSSTTELASR